MPDVAAVVVTYNALPYVERTLESLERHETVVVDHGSSDGTLELVRRRFPRVKLVEQENRGLAAGWNRGVRETSTPFVLVLNADAWLVDDAADRLAAFAEQRERGGFVAPTPGGGGRPPTPPSCSPATRWRCWSGCC